MFFEFDLNSWMGSLAALLFMGGIVTVFSAALAALMCRTWREEGERTPVIDRPGTSLRKAA
jgi:hypothetical protein